MYLEDVTNSVVILCLLMMMWTVFHYLLVLNLQFKLKYLKPLHEIDMYMEFGEYSVSVSLGFLRKFLP